MGLVFYVIANKSKITILFGGKQTYDVFFVCFGFFVKLFEKFFWFPMRVILMRAKGFLEYDYFSFCKKFLSEVF